ncbi:MAG TPA: lamin tail domain-containing protein, partial [Chloroflexia bacterium]
MTFSSKVRSGHFAAILMLVAGFFIAVIGLGLAFQTPGARAAAPIKAAQQPNDLTNTNIVISQVYGGGGNAGATYTHDFIELFNPTNMTITVTGWAVQYASATGSTWQTTTLSGDIGPGKYYLVQEAVGAGGTTALPTPDATGNIPMSGTNGKVALTNTNATLTGTCPTGGTIVDFVGYGSANCFEGAAAAPVLTNTTAAHRAGAGCIDTDNNGADFTAAAPTPRNSQSPANPCVVNTPTITNTATETGTPTETVTPGGPTFTETGTATETSIPTETGTATQTRTATATANVTIRIRNIQGQTHLSPLNGANVTNVPGIVTAKLSNGFYMQDPTSDGNDSTSEAIFVFTSSAPNAVQVGYSVLVGGTVTEFRPGGASADNLTTTEITGPTVSVVMTNATVPTPVVIGTGGRIPPNMVIEDDAGTGNVETSGAFDPAQDGIDFYESLEAMRVQVNNPVAVGPSNSFAEIAVLADNGANGGVRTTRGGVVVQANDFNPERIILDDTIMNTPSGVDVGDHFSGPAVGVMDYGFGNFKLYITQALTVVSGNLQQETAVPAAQGALSIGNYNVENLDPSDNTFGLHASAIITNLKAPDLLSIEEIQDNNGATNDSTVAANLTWQELIDAITAAGGPTYQYRQIDPVDDQDGGEPGGNIRVGLLFRTDRGLSFVDKPGGNSTTACTLLPDGTLAMSPCRVNPTHSAFNNSRKPLAGEFLYNGQKIIVIANHFSSKGGDDPLFGRWQPPIRSSEVARHQQAQIVNGSVDSMLNVNANANVVVAGDINDFQFSQTMNYLETGTISATGDLELQNLIETLPLSEQYTYVFDGNSQALDHALVSPNMLTYLVQYDVVHMNAEFDPQVSDHDPAVARFNIGGANTATPTSTSTALPSSTATRTATSMPS